MIEENKIIDAEYETITEIEDRTTEQLKTEVNGLYQQMEAVANVSLMIAAEAGRRLLVVKKRIPHGDFESWCDQNLEFSKSKAEKMMKLSQKTGDKKSFFSNPYTFTDLSISKVFALLAAPEDVAEEVVESQDVPDMTVRDLKAKLAAVKAAKDDHIVKLQERIEMLNAQIQANPDLQKKIEDLEKKLERAKEKAKAEAKKAEQAETHATNVAKSEAENDIKKARKAGRAEAEDQIKAYEEEIERLKKENKVGNNEDLTNFRIQTTILQETFNKCLMSLYKVEDDNAETATKLNSALAGILVNFRNQLENSN